MPQTLVEVLDENYVAPVVSHRSTTAKSAWVQAKSQTYEVNPNTVTFGVEVECYLPLAIFASLNLRVGGYHNGAACPTALDPQSIGWKCEQDGSISNTTPSGYGAVEFISPALCGMAGYVEVIVLLAALSGIFQAGLDLVFFDELMKTVPSDQTALFVSIAQSLQYMSAVANPLIGTLLADYIGLGGALLASAALRALAFLLFARGGGVGGSSSQNTVLVV